MRFSLFVDDLIYTSNSNALLNEFEMTDLGMMNFSWDWQWSNVIWEFYFSRKMSMILKGLTCKSAILWKLPYALTKNFSSDDRGEKIDLQFYLSLIGSLLYLTNSRLDILQATSILSRFMQSPSKHHLGAVKRILRYLKGTGSIGIWYKHTNNFKLCGFSYSDWVGSINDRKSTTDYVFFFFF